MRHRGEHLYIVLRDKARPNSEVLLASLKDIEAAAAVRSTAEAADVSESAASAPVPPLSVLLPHDRAIKLEGISLSSDFAVVFKREGGLQKASVYRLPAGGAPPKTLESGGENIDFDEPAYSLGSGYQVSVDDMSMDDAFMSSSLCP